jgi:hypothetical protein
VPHIRAARDDDRQKRLLRQRVRGCPGTSAPRSPDLLMPTVMAHGTTGYHRSVIEFAVLDRPDES